jgi:hypothetical protein
MTKKGSNEVGIDETDWDEVVKYTRTLPLEKSLPTNPTDDQQAYFQELREAFSQLADYFAAYITDQLNEVETNNENKLYWACIYYVSLYKVIRSGWKIIEPAIKKFLSAYPSPELYPDSCYSPGGVLCLCLLEEAVEQVTKTEQFSAFSPRKYIDLHRKVVKDSQRQREENREPSVPESERRNRLNSLEAQRSPERVGIILGQILDAAKRAVETSSGCPQSLSDAWRDYVAVATGQDAEDILRSQARHVAGNTREIWNMGKQI